LEDDQVEELRAWAQGLAADSDAEVRAAGKAIVLLADDLRAARSALHEERLLRRAFEDQAGESAEIEDTLRERITALESRRRAARLIPPWRR
jgi:hypothetical protein